ncbi:hypothetical protein FACS1894113_0180 [Alphaproteobacteria bacterium]|nr:hypothetical protein FACS1894113_0180 [Alphaproteobacteria bacterium]
MYIYAGFIVARLVFIHFFYVVFALSLASASESESGASALERYGSVSELDLTPKFEITEENLKTLIVIVNFAFSSENSIPELPKSFVETSIFNKKEAEIVRDVVNSMFSFASDLIVFGSLNTTYGYNPENLTESLRKFIMDEIWLFDVILCINVFETCIKFAESYKKSIFNLLISNTLELAEQFEKAKKDSKVLREFAESTRKNLKAQDQLCIDTTAPHLESNQLFHCCWVA